MPDGQARHQEFFDWLQQLYGDDVAVIASYLDQAPDDLSRDPYLGTLYQTFRAGVELAPQSTGGFLSRLGAGLGGGRNTMRQNFPGAQSTQAPAPAAPRFSTVTQQYFQQLADYLDYEVARGVYTPQQAQRFLDSAFQKAEELASVPPKGAIMNPKTGQYEVFDQATGKARAVSAAGPENVDITELPFFTDVKSNFPKVQQYMKDTVQARGDEYAARDVSRYVTEQYAKDQRLKQANTLAAVRGSIEGQPLKEIPRAPMPGIETEKIMGIPESLKGGAGGQNLARFAAGQMSDVAQEFDIRNPGAREKWWKAVSEVPYYAQVSSNVEQAYARRKELEPLAARLQQENLTALTSGGVVPESEKMSDIDRQVSLSALSEIERLKAIEDAARAEYGSLDKPAEETDYQTAMRTRLAKSKDPFTEHMQKYPWYEKFISQAPTSRGFYSRTYRPPTRFGV